jgi:hypothetical protein
MSPAQRGRRVWAVRWQLRAVLQPHPLRGWARGLQPALRRRRAEPRPQNIKLDKRLRSIRGRVVAVSCPEILLE